jgi:glutathione S-transferase
LELFQLESLTKCRIEAGTKMLKLYHYDRSTAAQRVRLGLEEKGLKWESIIVDTAMGDASQRPDNFHEFNPKGLIPLLDHDGFIIPESTLILEYLDDVFRDHKSLSPSTAQGRARMKLWMRKIDDGIHVASRTIGVCIVNRHFYKEAETKTIADYYKKMRDETRKSNDKINTELGLESPLLKPSLQAFKNLFIEMDNHLAEQAWLAGDKFSLADISLVVYLTRLTSFQMAPLWVEQRHLSNWFDRIKNFKSYKKAVDDWGDITAERRQIEGEKSFSKIKSLWDSL